MMRVPLIRSTRDLIAALAAVVALFSWPCAQAGQPAAPPTQSRVPDVIRAEDKLPTDVVPLSYDVAVTPDAQSLTTQGHASIDIEVRRPTRAITLNAYQIDFRRVTLDQVWPEAGDPPVITLDPAHERATLTFAQLMRPGRHQLTIDFISRIARASYGLFAVDITNPEGGADQLLATQFENSGARRFMPCWDEPALKASFTLHVTAPADRMVVGNMPVLRTTALSDGGKLIDFTTTPKMSSYLLFLSIGDYERIHRTVEGVDVGVIMRRGQIDKGAYALDAAAASLKFYNSYFGVPYPLPKLDMIAAPLKAPELSGMENWGAIFYFEPAFALDASKASGAEKRAVFRVVAHEIAHQWLGDLVTMRDWNELWLNEGLADWMEVKAAMAAHPDWGGWAGELAARERAFAWDARGSTPPMVRPLGVASSGPTPDPITYEKGEFLARMIEDHIGEAAFRDGLRGYLRAHQFGNVTGDDLWRALRATSHRDVAAIGHDFTDQSGLPLLTVESVPGGLRVRQSRYGIDETARVRRAWRTPVRVARADRSAEAEYMLAGTKPVFVAARAGAAVTLNVGQKGYLRVDYDPASFEPLRRDFADLASIDQLGLLYDQVALAESGDRPIGGYLSLLRRIPKDADPLVWLQALSALELFDTLAADNPDRPRFRAAARALLAPVSARMVEMRPGESRDLTNLRSRLALDGVRFGDAAGDSRTLEAQRGQQAAAERVGARRLWLPEILAWARPG